MSSFPQKVKTSLLNIVSDMAQKPEAFVRNPSTDFSRNRKLSFENTMKLIISMGGSTLNTELINFFQYRPTAIPSASAFVQQRAKLLPEAFQYLFDQFNKAFPATKFYKGFRLIACDGSDVSFTANPADKDNFIQPPNASKGYNSFHLNALYDLSTRTYVDALIQSGHSKDEFRALCDMVDRYSPHLAPKTIFIADRGYPSYNVFAHIIEKGGYFLIRAKDKGRCGMVGRLPLPDQDEFDTLVDLTVIRRQTKEIKAHLKNPRYLKQDSAFDYVEYGSDDTYPMSLRIVRFRIPNGSYECIVTNLPQKLFSPEEIKQLYGRRWEEETSFRELKYAVGLIHLHSKKAEFVIQEIWARMILYNFCEMITAHIVVEKRETRYRYQLNYTMAIKICRHFLQLFPRSKKMDTETLISRYLLPVKDGRTFSRQVKVRHQVSFLYRIS
jgi:Transposase DDE domain.